MAIEVGKAAPPFTLESSKGESVSLSDLRGRHVILYFYPEDDTPGCTKEACGFRDLWSEIRERNAVVLGISPDDGDSHDRFRAKYGLPFTLLSDPDKSMMKRYESWGEKVRDGKKSIGVIRSTVWIDPEGKVKRHWKPVSNAETHPEQVLRALESEA